MSKSLLSLFVFMTFLTLKGQETLGEIERLDPQLDLLIPKNASIEVLAKGFVWAEGPLWVPRLNGLLFTEFYLAYLWTDNYFRVFKPQWNDWPCSP